MKKISCIILISILFFSCQEKPKPADVPVEPELHTELYGSWIGEFWIAEDGSEGTEAFNDDSFSDKLNINIKRITKDSVIAQSVLAGQIKPLKGKLEEKNGSITFLFDQPTTDNANGRFEIKLRNDSLIGNWKAYKKSSKLVNREFELVKKAPIYDAKLMLPKDYDFIDWETSKTVNKKDTVEGKVSSYEDYAHRSPTKQIYTLNASTVALNENELKNLRKLDLEIIRNTIFARHGYAFKSKNVRQFFDPIEWYIPIKENIDNELTALEKKNIALLSRLEKYATDSYDAYGR
jgi:hypothetical protein